MSLRLIAQSLGLSITTVSRALSDYSDVAEDTKRRVLDEAARIGYVPNALARRLQKGRADSIALATRIDNLGNTDTMLFDAVAATWSRLVELQLDTVLLGIGLDPERDMSEKGAFKRTVRERTVDGIILIRPTIGESLFCAKPVFPSSCSGRSRGTAARRSSRRTSRARRASWSTVSRRSDTAGSPASARTAAISSSPRIRPRSRRAVRRAA
jgi:hypothetical protein